MTSRFVRARDCIALLAHRLSQNDYAYAWSFLLYCLRFSRNIPLRNRIVLSEAKPAGELPLDAWSGDRDSSDGRR